MFRRLLVLLLIVNGSVIHGGTVARALDQWPQWRGPMADGVAPHGDPPVNWSERKNLRWKTAIPGKGHSTPIVWGDHVYLTTAVPFGEALPHAGEPSHGAHDNRPPDRRMHFIVIAIDRRSGKIDWQVTLASEQPHDGAHVTASWASASAVTDGQHLIASFGSQGIFGLTMDGRRLWSADLGNMEIYHGHGEGSTPVLYGKTLIVNWDHQGESFIVALDKHNGKERWRVARDEITSWSTPLVVEHEGRRQVITASTRRVRSYDLSNGKLIWECSGLARNVVASPVAANGIVYVANSYDRQAMFAIRLDDARGDVTGTDAVLWTRERDTPYVPSPVLDGDALCFMKHNQGFLTCVDARSGRTRFGPERLEGLRNVFASPVAAAGRIYVVDRNGNTAVVRHADGFELLAMNRLDDSFSASPAVVGGELYLRGESNLYCIAEDGATGSD